jgi:superfamily II DNA or RNA helicase
MTRDERQEICLQKWVSANCLATIEGFTGFGKTRIATNAIKLLRRNDATRSVVIVVPTIPLKNQWIDGLNSLGLSDNTEVYVINTLITMPEFDASLVILDEIHRYAAETFSRVFDVSKYSFVLGLTATLKRLDKKHTFLEKYAPICDKVTMLEGKRNGWVAPFTEYNLGLELNTERAEEYREMKDSFGYYFDKFENDFELMKKCSFAVNPQRSKKGFIYPPPVIRHAWKMGWKGNKIDEAFNIMVANQSAPRGQKEEVWGSSNHPYAPQKLYVWALQGMRVNREMMSFIYNDPMKVAVVERLVREFSDSKAITFCQTTRVADELSDSLGAMAMPYHSNMESTEVTKSETKHYKTERGVDGWLEKHPEWGNKRTLATGFSVSRRKVVKVSANEARKQALIKVQESRRVRVVCTAKALDMGFDFPGCQLGIIYARTSSTTQQIQRTGRIIRKHFFEDGTEKRSVVINVYLKDTKDYQWLNRAQKKSAGARWVDTVEEIVEAEQKLVLEL